MARGCPRNALHFVGSERGVEAARLPAAGYPLTLLSGRGLRRRLSPANLWSNLVAVGGLSRALVHAFGLLRRDRPGVVLATGGYASAPCALAAALSGVPLVVAEQNAVLGSANRLGAAARRGGGGVVVPRHPAAAARLPQLRRRPRLRRRRRAGVDAVVTGNPVRTEMLAVDRAADGADARRRLGVPDDRRLLVVYGGSLGAEHLNRATADACRRWGGRGDLAVRHVLGDRDWERSGGACVPAAARRLLYQPVRYEDDLPTCLAAADLVVARAGRVDGGRVDRGRGTQPPRPPARRPRRPPDRQRPSAWRRPAPPRSAPTPSSTAPGWWRWWTSCWPTPRGWSAWRRPPPPSAGGTPPAPWPTSSWPTPAARSRPPGSWAR